MRRRVGQLGMATVALWGAPVAVPVLAGDHEEFSDPRGDAVVRRTNSCNCGVLGEDRVLPDVEKIVISAWQAISPATDRFTGFEVSHSDAHLVRIDVVLSGLVNPPGPLGLNGPYEPFMFGPNPLYGFVEIDVDGDLDTGGDQGSSAPLHFLANAARFGGRPSGPIGDRAATSSGDVFQPWNQAPEIRLSGADWVLTFCGCFTPTVVYQSNDDSTFGAGCTWVLEGRFFPRADGYQGASTMATPGGGVAPGLYDPIVQVQFRHSMSADKTTVSLVYALDPVGAAQLAGHPGQIQGLDSSASNDTSIAEGVNDLIAYSQNSPFFVPGTFEYQIEHRWASKSISSAIDVTRWRPTFIVGTADEAESDGLYLWTDIGFGCLTGDMNGSGIVSAQDRCRVRRFIHEHDGQPDDADDIYGQVTLANYGLNYSMFDVDGDGVIGPADLAFFDHVCSADFDRSGLLTVQDIFAFLNAWFSGAPGADYNESGEVTVRDIFDFLAAWFAGC